MHYLKKLKSLLLSNIWLITLIIFTAIFCYKTCNVKLKKEDPVKDYKVQGYINKIINLEDKIQFELIGNKKVLANYYLNEDNYDNLCQLELGDYVEVGGILNVPSENTNFNLFNYRKYLLSKKIEYTITIEKITLVTKNKNIFYAIKNSIVKLIEKNKSSRYLKAFILGDTNEIEENIKTSFQFNGISHLFSVSGMHVGFLSSIIFSFLTFINKKKKINEIIVISFLIFYAFLTGFSPSILRSVIFMLLLFIKNIFKIPISSFKMFLVMTCFFLIYNPWYIYNTGFLYSFTISGFLIYFNKYYKDKSYFKKILLISLISFLVGLPITLFNSFSINLISIFLNLVFVPFVSFIIFPLSFVVLLIPFLSFIYEFLVFMLENLSLFSSNHLSLTLNLAKPNIVGIIIYYLIILLIFRRPKRLINYFLLSIYFIIYYNIHFFNFNPILTIIDQTTPNMIQGLKGIFERNALISRGYSLF